MLGDLREESRSEQEEAVCGVTKRAKDLSSRSVLVAEISNLNWDGSVEWKPFYHLRHELVLH